MAAPTYEPFVTATNGGLVVTAMVGIHAASIAWSVDHSMLDAGTPGVGLLGFALKRSCYRASDDSVVRVEFVEGQKRFECDTQVGVDVTSDRAPFQRFRWSDYRLDPRYYYDYEVIPVYGRPCALDMAPSATVRFRPSEPVVDGTGIYVNRGVTSARAYQTRFNGQRPDTTAGAYTWLSRGLEESLLGFIADTQPGDELHVAIYEFHHPPVAAALKAARQRGVTVRIVVHQTGDGASKESEHVLRGAGIWSLATPRTNAKISHNKFVVRLRGGTPDRVWTGSANFSSNAFYLQTNQALTFDDPAVAAAFEAYWDVLHGDPSLTRTDRWGASSRCEAVMADHVLGDDRRLLVSPVRREHVLDAACELIEGAQSCVFMSAPFGTVTRVAASLVDNPSSILEYGLVNTTARRTIDRLGDHNTRFFTPTRLETWMGRTWDAKAFGNHKIHAKSLVIDPWSDEPKVLVGSANFSRPSCMANDENALLITGDRRLAAVISTEFLRMFDHYKSRGFINALSADGPNEEHFLAPDNSWATTSFDPAARSHKYRDREVFVGRV